MNTEEVKYSMTLSDMVSGKLDHADHSAKKFEGTLGTIHRGLHNLGERAIRVGETLGISFAVIKLQEFFHEGIEKVHEFHIAEGQLERTLENVGERAGMTGEELVKMARATAREIPFTVTQIIEMETALTRFGNMTPKVYQQVLTASADIATALKRDGKEVAFSLGRIMEAPSVNGRLLRQFGISLDQQQRKYLATLERTGHVAKAQTFIFEQLAQKGFAGAAKAAADSDPLFRYNKIMGRLKFSLGEVGITILEKVAPALEKLAGFVESSIQWFTRNKEIAEALGTALVTLGGAYVAYWTTLKVVEGWQGLVNIAKTVGNYLTSKGIGLSALSVSRNAAEATSLEALAAAQEAVNVAKTEGMSVGFGAGLSSAAGAGGEIAAGVGGTALMASGIGEIVAAVVAVAGIGYLISQIGGGSGKSVKPSYIKDEEEEPHKKMKSGAQQFYDFVKKDKADQAKYAQYLKNSQKEQQDAYKDTSGTLGQYDRNISMAADHTATFSDAMANGAKKINDTANAVKFSALSFQDFINREKQLKAASEWHPAAMPKLWSDIHRVVAKQDHTLSVIARDAITKESTLHKLTSKGGKHLGLTHGPAGEVSKVTGSHPININIKIDSLIKGFTIATTNLPESAMKIKEEVTKVLLSAVNDSQIVAGI